MDKNKRKIDFTKKDIVIPGSKTTENRFTIEDLEKALILFKKDGSESELQAFIREIMDETRNLKSKRYASSFEEETSLGEIKILIANKINSKNIKEIASKTYKNNYFRHIASVTGIFVIVYLLFNLPIYYSRISWFFEGTKTQIVKYSEIEQKPMASSAPLEKGEIIPAGSSIVIPRLKINAPIVTINSFEEADIQAGLQNGVVRLGKMSKPGKPGTTFITGHSSNYWWDKGSFNYVFVLLDKLEAGDNIKLYDSGNKYVYEVVNKKIVDPTDTSSIVHTDKPTLTLMTCYPPGSTSKRLLVSFKQVAPTYYVPKVVEKEKVIDVPRTLPSNDRKSFWDVLRDLW